MQHAEASESLPISSWRLVLSNLKDVFSHELSSACPPPHASFCSALSLNNFPDGFVGRSCLDTPGRSRQSDDRLLLLVDSVTVLTDWRRGAAGRLFPHVPGVGMEVVRDRDKSFSQVAQARRMCFTCAAGGGRPSSATPLGSRQLKVSSSGLC